MLDDISFVANRNGYRFDVRQVFHVRETAYHKKKMQLLEQGPFVVRKNESTKSRAPCLIELMLITESTEDIFHLDCTVQYHGNCVPACLDSTDQNFSMDVGLADKPGEFLVDRGAM